MERAIADAASRSEHWNELEVQRQRIESRLQSLDAAAQQRELERGRIGIFFRTQLRQSLHRLREQKAQSRRYNQQLLARIDEAIAVAASDGGGSEGTLRVHETRLAAAKTQYLQAVEELLPAWIQRCTDAQVQEIERTKSIANQLERQQRDHELALIKKKSLDEVMHQHHVRLSSLVAQSRKLSHVTESVVDREVSEKNNPPPPPPRVGERQATQDEIRLEIPPSVLRSMQASLPGTTPLPDHQQQLPVVSDPIQYENPGSASSPQPAAPEKTVIEASAPKPQQEQQQQQQQQRQQRKVSWDSIAPAVLEPEPDPCVSSAAERVPEPVVLSKPRRSLSFKNAGGFLSRFITRSGENKKQPHQEKAAENTSKQAPSPLPTEAGSALEQLQKTVETMERSRSPLRKSEHQKVEHVEQRPPTSTKESEATKHKPTPLRTNPTGNSGARQSPTKKLFDTVEDSSASSDTAVEQLVERRLNPPSMIASGGTNTAAVALPPKQTRAGNSSLLSSPSNLVRPASSKATPGLGSLWGHGRLSMDESSDDEHTRSHSSHEDSSIKDKVGVERH